MSLSTDGTRASHRAHRFTRVLGVVALIGALVAPVAAVFTAGPAAATCDVTCSATVVTSVSPATIGSTITVSLHNGGSGNCYFLTADPGSGSTGSPSLGGDFANFNKTSDSGNDDWSVSYNGPPGTVTYAAHLADSCGFPWDGQSETVIDTAQVDWRTPDPNSTLTASPSLVVADGASTSTVSLVLTGNAFDNYGQAQVGQTVRLTNLPAGAQANPASTTTGAGGRAVFTVTSTQATANPATIFAQRFDGTQWQSLSGVSTTITFFPPDFAEPAFSSVAASLYRVPSDGLSTTTITATLKDASGPLVGHSVRLNPSTSGPIVTALSGSSQTNSGGQVSFTVSDHVTETVTFTAIDDTSGSNAGTTTVRFGPVPNGEQGKGTSQMSLAPATDVVTSATLPDDGTTAAAVYVQLLCNDVASNGCNEAAYNMYTSNPLSNPSGAIAGAKVVLLPTSATSAVVTEVLDPTNAAGEARFLVTDTVPEDVTFNAVDVTNNVQLASADDSTSPPQVTPLKVTISFKGPGTPSATNSTASASPTTVAADGAAASTITVVLKDQNKINVPNKVVTLNPSGSATFTPAQATTDGNGVATFSTVDKHAETVNYMVQDVSDNVALTTFPQVIFTAGAPSPATSSVAASPTTVAADGTSKSTITVTITDANGGPVSGKTVSLTPESGNSTISAPSGPTNSNGVTTFSVRDNTPEAVTYKATDVTDGFDLTHTATVTFTGNPTSANSTIAADPTSVPANSIATSTVSVTLRDANGNPVAAKQLTLKKVSGGQEVITPVTPGSDTSNQAGVAAFSLSDGAVETVSVSAFDVTDNIALSATTKISFTGPPSGATSTVTANPAAVPADGATASTVTVTILDDAGQPIPGQNVTLAPNSGTHSSVTGGTNPTNAAGQATFTVTDGTAETVTYSATDVSVNPNQKIFATAQVSFGAMPGISSISPNYGPSTGGTKVTISGTKLSTAKSVLFGTTAGTGLSVNKKNGSLTVTSPSGTGVVDVRVLFPDNSQTPANAADKFSYQPAVTGISPTSGSHSGGTKVTISGTNFAGVTGVSFGGTAAASFSVSKNGTITATSPPGAAGTAVDVTVTSPGGTSATSAADKFTYN